MWKKILDEMYEGRDVNTLQGRIRDLLSKRYLQGADIHIKNSKMKLSREELNSQVSTGTKLSGILNYKDFVKIILDF